jgi:hypothetical protein
VESQLKIAGIIDFLFTGCVLIPSDLLSLFQVIWYLKKGKEFNPGTFFTV